jgi:hypothetical protein
MPPPKERALRLLLFKKMGGQRIRLVASPPSKFFGKAETVQDRSAQAQFAEPSPERPVQRWVRILPAIWLLGAGLWGEEVPPAWVPQGIAEPEAPVRKALAWLARHPANDGGWSVTGYSTRCEGKGCGPTLGREEHDVAVSALATRAFLAAGIKPNVEGKGEGNLEVVAGRALRYLQSRQIVAGDKKGLIGSPDHKRHLAVRRGPDLRDGDRCAEARGRQRTGRLVLRAPGDAGLPGPVTRRRPSAGPPEDAGARRAC